MQVQMKICELCASLKKAVNQRVQVMAKFKSDNLLSVSDFKSYGSPDHVKQINETLKSAAEDKLKSIELKK